MQALGVPKVFKGAVFLKINNGHDSDFYLDILKGTLNQCFIIRKTASFDIFTRGACQKYNSKVSGSVVG